MKGCIVYFSGTGNTEFVAKAIKNEFAQKDVLCDTYEITKNTGFEDKYDFYVFGGPIYAEMLPDFFTDWVKKNITKGKGRKCIVFSTQANKVASGPAVLAKDLRKIGFEVVIEDCIVMPNNYYLVLFKKFTEERVNEAVNNAKERAKVIVDKFLNNEKQLRNVKGREIWGKPTFWLFVRWSKKWAKKALSVDMNKCTRCGFCQKACPVKNIEVSSDKVIFFENCSSCQRCVHKCPKNAFLHKNKIVEQYKLKH